MLLNLLGSTHVIHKEMSLYSLQINIHPTHPMSNIYLGDICRLQSQGEKTPQN